MRPSDSHPKLAPLLAADGFSGRVVLCHGFNVKDQGQGTTDTLRPHFEAEGFEVLEFDTGWRGLLGVRFGNAKRAQKLARLIEPGDILVGHSDGCNLINQAAWKYAASAKACPFCVVYFNPALDTDTDLAPQVKGALVFYTDSDRVVQIAAALPWHPWGAMGRVGYKPADEAWRDTRYENCAYEHLGIHKVGHSGVFKHPGPRERVFVRIELFLQSLT